MKEILKPWSREKKEKDRDNKYINKLIQNTNLNIPVEYREKDLRNEL